MNEKPMTERSCWTSTAAAQAHAPARVHGLRADPLCVGVFAAHDPAIRLGEYTF